MFYLVYACDCFFMGLHGMYEVAIVETEDDRIIRNTGLEMSLDIIRHYIEIQKKVEELSEEEDYNYIKEELENDDVYWTSWELNSKKLPTHNIKELGKILHAEGWETFLEKYKQRAE